MCAIDFNIKNLPIALSDITDKLGIKLLNDSDVKELNRGERGATFKFNDNWYIVVNNTESVLVHELGHILLMLTDKVKYCTFEKCNKEEQAVDMVAAWLLALILSYTNFKP